MRDEYLTTQQAADRMGRSKQLIQRLCKEGRLPAIQPGKDYLIRARDVDAYKPNPRGRPSPTKAAKKATKRNVAAQSKRASNGHS